MSSGNFAYPLDTSFNTGLTPAVAKRSSAVTISGEAFADWRSQVLHLSQQQLADRSRLSLAGIQKIERRPIARVMGRTFAQIAEAVGVPKDELALKLSPPNDPIEDAFRSAGGGSPSARKLASLLFVNLDANFRRALMAEIERDGTSEVLARALVGRLLKIGTSTSGVRGARVAATSDVPPSSLDELEKKHSKNPRQ